MQAEGVRFCVLLASLPTAAMQSDSAPSKKRGTRTGKGKRDFFKKNYYSLVIFSAQKSEGSF